MGIGQCSAKTRFIADLCCFCDLPEQGPPGKQRAYQTNKKYQKYHIALAFRAALLLDLFRAKK